MPLRLALFTLESTASTPAVLAFLRAVPHEVVLVGRSDPFRPSVGGLAGQLKRHLRRSGLRLFPWLVAEFALPRVVSTLRRPWPGGSAGTLAEHCHSTSVPLVTVEDVNAPAMRARIAAARPDLLVSFHFDQIFTPETLALAPLGGINLHPSLLPRHRGPMPVFWALSDEDKAFGVTVHRLVPHIDAGAVLAQEVVDLPAGLTASAAARRLHMAGVPLLLGAIAGIATGTVPAREVSRLPYRPFPDPCALRDAARRGIRLTDGADLRAALTTRL